jgi:ornithine cyclodeaminase
VPKTVRILREADVRAALDMATCIDACERAFAAYSAGAAELPGVIHLEVPESGGEIHIKAGHLRGEAHYALKAASGFYSTVPPAIDGLVVVFDATNGAPVAFLLDGGLITDLRTGAAGGVAARHLAPARVDRVAVIGTGQQARQQLDALTIVRPGFEEVRIWGRDTGHAEACVADVRARLGLAGATVAVAASVRQAVDGADVILACTAAREPLVRADWVAPGAHITAVGSDGPGKQELDPQLVRSADLLVVDSRAQCAVFGELQHAEDQAGRAVELGEICAGAARGREERTRLTVCDLTGLGVQDVAAANVVVTRAGDRGDLLEL